jgi:hypothetical protein
VGSRGVGEEAGSRAAGMHTLRVVLSGEKSGMHDGRKLTWCSWRRNDRAKSY